MPPADRQGRDEVVPDYGTTLASAAPVDLDQDMLDNPQSFMATLHVLHDKIKFCGLIYNYLKKRAQYEIEYAKLNMKLINSQTEEVQKLESEEIFGEHWLILLKTTMSQYQSRSDLASKTWLELADSIHRIQKDSKRRYEKSLQSYEELKKQLEDSIDAAEKIKSKYMQHSKELLDLHAGLGSAESQLSKKRKEIEDLTAKVDSDLTMYKKSVEIANDQKRRFAREEVSATFELRKTIYDINQMLSARLMSFFDKTVSEMDTELLSLTSVRELMGGVDVDQEFQKHINVRDRHMEIEPTDFLRVQHFQSDSRNDDEGIQSVPSYELRGDIASFSNATVSYLNFEKEKTKVCIFEALKKLTCETESGTVLEWNIRDIARCVKKVDLPRTPKDSRKQKSEIIRIFLEGRTTDITLNFKNFVDAEKFFQAIEYIRKSSGSIQAVDEISVWVGTWNMGDAPPPADLSPWIPKSKVDIIVVGVQECSFDNKKRGEKDVPIPAQQFGSHQRYPSGNNLTDDESSRFSERALQAAGKSTYTPFSDDEGGSACSSPTVDPTSPVNQVYIPPPTPITLAAPVVVGKSEWSQDTKVTRSIWKVLVSIYKQRLVEVNNEGLFASFPYFAKTLEFYYQHLLEIKDRISNGSHTVTLAQLEEFFTAHIDRELGNELGNALVDGDDTEMSHDEVVKMEQKRDYLVLEFRRSFLYVYQPSGRSRSIFLLKRSNRERSASRPERADEKERLLLKEKPGRKTVLKKMDSSQSFSGESQGEEANLASSTRTQSSLSGYGSMASTAISPSFSTSMSMFGTSPGQSLPSILLEEGPTSNSWFDILKNHLGSDYTVVDTASMWAIKIAVFVRTDLASRINSVQRKTVPTGIAGVGGNKGGAVVCFNFDDLSLCFINSHLAAHQEKIRERNRDYREIIKGVKLGLRDFGIDSQFDHCFWLGDLNYRVNGPRAEVVDLANGYNYVGLLDRDQLEHEMKENRVFHGFKDGEITFPPSYKYEKNLPPKPDDKGRLRRVYTTEKMRNPSWTDRILVKSRSLAALSDLVGETGMKQKLDFALALAARRVSYDCCNELVTSDHSPVSSSFIIPNKSTYFPAGGLRAIMSTKGNCTIRITNLRAYNLQEEDLGTVNPYVKFYSPLFSYVATTPRCHKTLNPEWEDKDVPPLATFFSDTQYLAANYIMVLIVHNDVTGEANLGHCTLPLATIVRGGPNTKWPFAVKLTYHGLETNAQLLGTMSLSYD